jgi:nucleolar GTP-binding protein
MFTRIPTVLRSQEIIDKAFSKASKVEEPYHPHMEVRIRKEIQDRISSIEGSTVFYLRKMVKKFPSNDALHPFYRNLLDLMFDLDQYKISLSKLDRTASKIEEFSTQKIRQLKYIPVIAEMNKLMREYYGRVSSLIGDLDSDLSFLGRCRDFMKLVPEIEQKDPTFIISGMPNVGKSSFLSKITTATPRIASYPFTTQSIYIGYMERNGIRIQVIDTPGILDRPMPDRNTMELNAILALRHIDSIIIFLFDHSLESIYDTESQERLFNEIEKTMNKKMIRVQSKLDLSDGKKEKYAISATTGEGIDELVTYMLGLVSGVSDAAR